MKKQMLLVLMTLLTTISFSQRLLLVRDSAMNAYMKSGFATKNFRPEGATNERGLRHGAWKDYEAIEGESYEEEDGKPLRVSSVYLFYGEGEFVNGKRNGDWKIYVIEDKSFRKILSQTLSYKEGVSQGPFTYYYLDGKPAFQGTYKAGKIEGAANLLYPDGQVFGKQLFHDDKKEGRLQYYYPDGKLNFIVDYKGGDREGLFESYYPDGKLQETFHCVKDSADGTYRYYYPSGQLWTETQYKRGKLMNITGTYDPKGKPRDKGTLKDGNGTINYYTEEGKVYTVATFKDGEKIKNEDR